MHTESADRAATRKIRHGDGFGDAHHAGAPQAGDELHLRFELVAACAQGTYHAIADAPQMLQGKSRGERPQGSFRALSAKEERRSQHLICGKCPDQLSMPLPPLKRFKRHCTPRSSRRFRPPYPALDSDRNGCSLTIGPRVYFDNDSARIKRESEVELDGLMRVLM